MPNERISLDLRLRGSRLLIKDKLVTYSPDGLHTRFGAGKLLAQPGDVYINGTGIAVKVLSPDQAEQTLAVQHHALVTHERREQVELLGAQLNRFTADRDLAPRRVEPDVGNLEHAFGLHGALAASQDGLYAGYELARGERLRDVVVGANFEPDDLVDVVAAGGEDDHRYVRSLANLFADGQP